MRMVSDQVVSQVVSSQVAFLRVVSYQGGLSSRWS